MNKSSLWLLLLGFVLGIAITTYYCSTLSLVGGKQSTSTHVEIIYDTLRISNPKPITIEPIIITESINTETIDIKPIEVIYKSVANRSSPEPLNIYTFADTISGVWSAKVVGRDVELQELTLHNRIEHHTKIIYRPPIWEIMAQARIYGTIPCIGLNVAHTIERIHISGFMGYNPYVGSVVVGATFGVTIWRKY